MIRYRPIALHGGDGWGTRHPNEREHGVQVGGSGGRIIGDGWRLDRAAAERLAEELQMAFDAGAESREGDDG